MIYFPFEFLLYEEFLHSLQQNIHVVIVDKYLLNERLNEKAYKMEYSTNCCGSLSGDMSGKELKMDKK